MRIRIAVMVDSEGYVYTAPMKNGTPQEAIANGGWLEVSEPPEVYTIVQADVRAPETQMVDGKVEDA